jgi:hypothetical protein
LSIVVRVVRFNPWLSRHAAPHRIVRSPTSTETCRAAVAASIGSCVPKRAAGAVKMIDRTYGHLVAGADAYERQLLDAFDANPRPLGRGGHPGCRVASDARTTKAPRVRSFCVLRERRDSNPRPPA